MNERDGYISNTDDDSIEKQISERLQKLNLSSERAVNDIFRKNIEAEKLKHSIKAECKKLKRIQLQIEQAKVEQERAIIL